jgi:hypothetical protein
VKETQKKKDKYKYIDRDRNRVRYLERCKKRLIENETERDIKIKRE